MNQDGELRANQEAGARLSGAMGKGKGEAWAPATIFISHIVLLSRSPSFKAGRSDSLTDAPSTCTRSSTTTEREPHQSSPRNCGKLAPLGTIGAVAQSGERRLCTAEVRGSNPLGSTLKKHVFAGKIYKSQRSPGVHPGLLTATVLQPALPQRVLKGAGRAILHGGQYVGVSIQGYGYGGVPQHLGDYLGVDVPRQE